LISQKIQAYAKINLFLDVLSKQQDGYHEIYSLISKIDLHDDIEIVRNKSLDVIFEGSFSSMIKYNNIETLFEYLFSKNYLSEFPFKIKISKNIPVGAGLGGGSSNIASVLMYLRDNKLINEAQCLNAARDLGSDIEFFFETKPSFVVGRGIVDRSVKIINEKKVILLIYPQVDLSTKEVFKNNKSFVEKSKINEHSKYLDLMEILESSTNSLEPSAKNLCKDIDVALSCLSSHKNSQFERMTGSGSCVFGIFNDLSTASRILRDIQSKNPHWWLKVTKLI
tara:strand:- start:2189 stop:3031 length:843 start_codon:yes stop_codon:yes gene_type:complete